VVIDPVFFINIMMEGLYRKARSNELMEGHWNARTLKQRVVGSNPGEGTALYL
jgi:hypothetical protein